MKLNEDTYHLPVVGHRYETLWVNIAELRIWESEIYLD